jgi:hypothetical protein
MTVVAAGLESAAAAKAVRAEAAAAWARTDPT